MPAEAKPGSTAPAPPKRRSRWLDRVIGIVLGLALGIGVIVIFVFEGSEGTIDAPRISGIQGSGGRSGGPSRTARVPLVKVIGGRPPQSGPVRLDFRQGRSARFVVGSDQELGIEVVGYGLSRTVGPGRTLVSFKARKPGQFPIVVSASEIEIASLRIARP